MKELSHKSEKLQIFCQHFFCVLYCGLGAIVVQGRTWRRKLRHVLRIYLKPSLNSSNFVVCNPCQYFLYGLLVSL